MEHGYFERVADFRDAKRVYQRSAAAATSAVEGLGGAAAEGPPRFRPCTREVVVPAGLPSGPALLARCAAAVLKA